MKNSTKILAAAAIGVVAGSALGLLFAPDKGYEIRKKIANQSGKMMKTIQGGFDREKLGKLKEKLEQKLQKIKAKMDDFSKEDATKA